MENDLLNPLVVSYCNKYNRTDKSGHENTRRFIETLDNNNWNYTILGEGEEWKGFNYRMETYKNYLKTLDPNKIVIMSDAHDVYCLKKPNMFINEFKTLNKDIIVGLEIFAEGSPLYYEKKDYFQVIWLGPYFKHNNINYNKLNKKFVNAGLIFGYAKNIIEFYEWALNNNYTDDQKALGKFMNTYPDKVGIDLNNDMIHTTTAFVNAGIESINQFKDSPNLNELIGQSSYFIHIPGHAISKGQDFLYNVVYKILLLINFNVMQNLYPYYNLIDYKEYQKNIDLQNDQYINK